MTLPDRLLEGGGRRFYLHSPLASPRPGAGAVIFTGVAPKTGWRPDVSQTMSE